MIEVKVGDILADDAEALVNTVNCVGVMGRGIALQFKKAWPENFKAYAQACTLGEVRPGRMFVVSTGLLTPPYYIINFPTKRHWRGKSRMEDIEAGLADLVDVLRARKIRSVAIPPLGSGLGGLEWSMVKGRIVDALTRLEDVRVTLYEPRGEPTVTHRRSAGTPPKMTPGRAALVGLMDRYLQGLLDPAISLLEVHKLMYFMQEAGEDLRLKVAKGPYGPYAENLRHVLNAIEGYYVSGYGAGGDAPEKELTLVPGALDDAKARLAWAPATKERFERVANLVEGFESSFGLELLSTTHWVIRHEGLMTDSELTSRVHAWNKRKERFSERQIGLARAVLQERGWVPDGPTSTDRSQG